MYKRQAQDWAQMLYRMYTRWTERHDFTYQILDYEEDVYKRQHLHFSVAKDGEAVDPGAFLNS